MNVTGPLIKVLRSLVDQHGIDVAGIDLVRATKLKSGTVYPMLYRLEDNGWLSARWDVANPRKRLYTLTGLGASEAHRLLTDESGGFAWA